MLGYERLQILARFERHLGHKKNTLKLYQKAYNGLANQLGKKNKKTIVAKSNYGNQLREMGKFVEAEHVLAECLKTASECLSEYDPIYLIIMNNYGLLKKNIGDLRRLRRSSENVKLKGWTLSGKGRSRGTILPDHRTWRWC